ncbi:septum formation family protein [Amycolatopsis rhizosphaerae]|uniref:septum formation family protein n=1 Tax=Amycolatopsis rhizosphaerae TaxID=2053003 RepID=UPI001FE6FEE1|nr:septum formation family protein [Amycolatopsis rhizosphaerae]
MLKDGLASNTLRTRLVMVGGFFGAILALSLSVAFSSGSGITGGGKVEESPEAKASFHSAAGNCLTWKQPDASDIHLVPCAQEHLYEVTGVVNIADKYPAGAPAPTVDQWREIALNKCTDGTEGYLHEKLDPYGRFTVSALRPGNDEWAAGDRDMRCVLQWAAPGGALQPITGPVAGQSQAAVWEPGTCLALAGKTVGNPIACTQPHAYEIVGKLDLKTRFTSGYPAQKDQKTWLDTECNNVVQRYAGGVDLTAQQLTLTWDLREQESWDAGSTLVNCKVGAKLPDNSGLAPITGSIRQAAQDAPQDPNQQGGQPGQTRQSGSGGGN